MAVSSQAIQDDLGAKYANWVAGCVAVWLSELSTSFPCLSGHGVDLGLELAFLETSQSIAELPHWVLRLEYFLTVLLTLSSRTGRCLEKIFNASFLSFLTILS